MTLRKFALEPFPGEGGAPDVTITGTIGRRGNRVSVRCTLLGDLSKVVIPSPGALPARRNRLWEETCLELFLGGRGCAGYWEFNLSPAGHWNVYRFASYRKGMREERAFSSLPYRVQMDPEALTLSLEPDVGKIVPAAGVVEAAVTAVLKTRMGGTSYWALVHPGPRPDFHRRDGFRFILPAGGAP